MILINKFLIILSLFFISCTSVKPLLHSLKRFEYERKFDETDHIPIFDVGDAIPNHYAILGEIHIRVGDYEINEPCSYEAALDKFIIKSIYRGGDAVKIINVKPPDIINICWRISGLALSYDQ